MTTQASSPQTVALKIGPYQIKPVPTGLFALDGGAMFGTVPKVLWEKVVHLLGNVHVVAGKTGTEFMVESGVPESAAAYVADGAPSEDRPEDYGYDEPEGSDERAPSEV